MTTGGDWTGLWQNKIFIAIHPNDFQLRSSQNYLKEYSGIIPHILVTLKKYLGMFFLSSHNPIRDGEVFDCCHLLV